MKIASIWLAFVCAALAWSIAKADSQGKDDWQEDLEGKMKVAMAAAPAQSLQIRPVLIPARSVPPAEPGEACAHNKGKAGCDNYYPDPALTPGKFDTKIVQANIQETVCKDGYTRTVRDVTPAEENQVLSRYQTARDKYPFNLEIDHFVSLELGGTNELENLWPQPYCEKGTGGLGKCIGAREKDVVETSLKRFMCGTKTQPATISLDGARCQIMTDWYSYYVKIEQRKKGEPPPPLDAACAGK